MVPPGGFVEAVPDDTSTATFPDSEHVWSGEWAAGWSNKVGDEGFPDVWRGIDLIAQRTEAVAGIVVYPFVILVIMILSRSSYFERWDWPAALITLWSVNSIFVIFCGLVLHRSAEKARRTATEGLHLQRMKEQAKDNDQRVKSLSLSIEEVERERRGAFAPLVEQPVFRAILYPFGGVGVAAYLERFVGLFTG